MFSKLFVFFFLKKKLFCPFFFLFCLIYLFTFCFLYFTCTYICAYTCTFMSILRFLLVRIFSTNSKTLVGWLVPPPVSRPTVTRVTFDLPECEQPEEDKTRKTKMNRNARKKQWEKQEKINNKQKNQKKERKKRDLQGPPEAAENFFFLRNGTRNHAAIEVKRKRTRKKRVKKRGKTKPWTLKVALRPSGVLLVLFFLFLFFFFLFLFFLSSYVFLFSFLFFSLFQ